jgi:predicted 2-oxoglutarate/Fe(II)-dependent dioxygenase YbiX
VTGTVKLNDEHDGGELEFPRYGFTNKKSPVGSMLVWPSGLQHIHRSTPVARGTKYSLVAWTKTSPQQDGLNYGSV